MLWNDTFSRKIGNTTTASGAGMLWLNELELNCVPFYYPLLWNDYDMLLSLFYEVLLLIL